MLEIDIKTVDPKWAWDEYEVGPDGPWNHRLAAHFYRRAGFGASQAEINTAAKMSLSELYRKVSESGPETAAIEREMDLLANTIVSSGNPEGLAAAWLYRLLHSDQQLLEKSTLFWHGHFATSADKVASAELMWRQNRLLRKNALGDFREMVQGIASDPAMLIYLDSTTNRKSHPNENFAREVMELFCLGEGNYSEEDIKELARCFTGWEVRREQFRFNRYQHDFGEKTILGKRAEFSGQEAIDVVLDQSSASRFIARKLVHYFVFDEPLAPSRLIEPLAVELENNRLQVGPTIRRILLSRMMFSTASIGRKIRSPVEMAVSLLRALEGTVNTRQLSDELLFLGQRLFYPPNVKGWDGGRTWINSSTLLGRANLVGRVMSDSKTRFAKGTLEDLADKYRLNDSRKMVQWFSDLLLAVPLPHAVEEDLVRLGDHEPEIKRRMQRIVQVLGALPEFQLS